MQEKTRAEEYVDGLRSMYLAQARKPKKKEALTASLISLFKLAQVTLTPNELSVFLCDARNLVVHAQWTSDSEYMVRMSGDSIEEEM